MTKQRKTLQHSTLIHSAILSESGGTVKLNGNIAYLHTYIQNQPFLPTPTAQKHHLHGDYSAYPSTLGSACDQGLTALFVFRNTIASDFGHSNPGQERY